MLLASCFYAPPSLSETLTRPTIRCLFSSLASAATCNCEWATNGGFFAFTPPACIGNIIVDGKIEQIQPSASVNIGMTAANTTVVGFLSEEDATKNTHGWVKSVVSLVVSTCLLCLWCSRYFVVARASHLFLPVFFSLPTFPFLLSSLFYSFSHLLFRIPVDVQGINGERYRRQREDRETGVEVRRNARAVPR